MQRYENMKFFIVDDDPFCRSLYSQHLINLGYRDNIVFDKGYDCIKRLDLRPDVIFLDYDMQPYNGLEILQRVKQYNPHIHLLIISSHKDTEIINDAMKYGAYDYIMKGEKDLEMISKVIKRIVVQNTDKSKANQLEPC